MTLDTGCSGSMVALHLACHSLRSKETDLALAGGTNLILSPDFMFAMSNFGFVVFSACESSARLIFNALEC